ncbi:MAG: DinB family protein [Ignavibacteriae bacterium]|nr:DinB family protein [Ignavibacteriota bacterium]
MTEKDMWLQTREMELQTTLRVLRAVPTHRLDYKPHEKSRSVKELAWIFAAEEAFAGMIINGKIEFGGEMPSPPATMDEILGAFESASKATNDRVRIMTDDDYNSMMDFPVAPNKMEKMRKADLLWMMVMDAVHHRGQMSVYLRLVGGKVPSIYGPTADEPWM